MISRSLSIALLAAGCLTAAAGGSYMAGRQTAATAPQVSPPPTASPQPELPLVIETEGVVTPSDPRREASPAHEPLQPDTVPRLKNAPAPPVERRGLPRTVPARASIAVRGASDTATAPAIVSEAQATAPGSGVMSEGFTAEPPAVAEPARDIDASPRPAEPVRSERSQRESADEGGGGRPGAGSRAADSKFEEVVIPASAVVGLQLETLVTSERARLEDRVDARVTRDVYADGRLAIPSGSRVVGAVTLVERGGKVKERARLGVRFHTLVLANGRQVSLRTETVYRDGESPSAESSRKIGGSAIGGAVLGAIMGGGKGAIAGASVGAAGGAAAVMAGGRNAATLASGSIITVRLSAPASFEVEK